MFQQNQITLNTVIKSEFLYQLVYVLQVKVDRHNYNSYVVIYITWLRQSCYVFTTQWKFNVHIYKISKDRYNVVKLSPHMLTS